MFGSSVVEVAIGLAFSFLAVSLATSSLVEALASITRWRSYMLLKGIKDLVNDPNLEHVAKALYQHALINPRESGQAPPGKRSPAYVDPRQFANALMDIAGMTSALGGPRPPAIGPQTVAALQTAVNLGVSQIRNPQLHGMLQDTIQRCAGDVEKIRQDLANWFDNAMDRVSGAYKRHTQAVGFAVALLLSAGRNVNAIQIAQATWAQPALVQALHVSEGQPTAEAAINALNKSLPVGWPEGQWMHLQEGRWQQQMLGWLITAFATLFGAPFWFDLLQGVVRLKGSGPSPGEKQVGASAAR